MATKPRSPDVIWQLVQLDGANKGTVIAGQFVAENYREDAATVWAGISIPQRSAPVDQWIRGDTQAATFNARLYDTTGGDDLGARVALLRQAIAKDAKLQRPPLYRFVWGAVSFDCAVESLGEIRYDELWADGRIKGLTLTIRLRRQLTPLDLQPTDTSKPVHLSRHKPVVDGDDYEGLALREYGDPSLGVYLRQDAKLAFPGAGQTVRLPEADYYAGRSMAPRAYALGDSTPAAVALRTLMDARGGSATVPYVAQ